MNIQQMMIQAQKMQRELKKKLEEFYIQEFSNSKGGAVTVTMYGSKKIKEIKLDEDALDNENKEMLEDMIALAINELIEEITTKEKAIQEGVTGHTGLMF